MAACKPEVVITQERNKIEAKSQRLHQHFRPWPTYWNWSRHCPISTTFSRQPEIAMAAYKPEVVINQKRYEISAKFGRILDIFDHAQHAGAISDIVRCRPTFSRQPEVAMEAYKPEVVITQERNEIEAKFQRLHQHFRPWSTYCNWSRHCPMSTTFSRQPEIAMAAYKPEVVINQERYEISAKFVRILDIFDHAQHVGALANIVPYRPTFHRQPEITMAANHPVLWPPLLFP